MSLGDTPNPTPTLFHSAADYLDLPTAKQPWIVQDLLPAGGLLNLYGAPKTGKSYGMLQLATAIASGAKEWLGFPIRCHGRVMYLQLDTPRTLWQGRLLKLQSQGVEFTETFIADRTDAPYPFDILSEENGLGWFKQAVREIQPLVIVIDTLRELHLGDENDSRQGQQVVNAAIEAAHGAAIILVSHAKKDNPMFGDSVVNDNRGTSYIAGRMDTIIKVSKKFVMIEGRALEDQKLPIRRDEKLFWLRGLSDDAIAASVMKDPNLPNQIEKAKKFAALSGRKTESARSWLKRYIERKEAENGEEVKGNEEEGLLVTKGEEA